MGNPVKKGKGPTYDGGSQGTHGNQWME